MQFVFGKISFESFFSFASFVFPRWRRENFVSLKRGLKKLKPKTPRTAPNGRVFLWMNLPLASILLRRRKIFEEKQISANYWGKSKENIFPFNEQLKLGRGLRNNDYLEISCDILCKKKFTQESWNFKNYSSLLSIFRLFMSLKLNCVLWGFLK